MELFFLSSFFLGYLFNDLPFSDFALFCLKSKISRISEALYGQEW